MVKDAGQKQMKTGPHPDQSAFTALTRKQIAVLDLLANNRTSKEIGHALGIAEATVNRRIEVLRSRLGGVTRHELARRYRDWTSLADTFERAADPCVETPPNFYHSPSRGSRAKSRGRTKPPPTGLKTP